MCQAYYHKHKPTLQTLNQRKHFLQEPQRRHRLFCGAASSPDTGGSVALWPSVMQNAQKSPVSDLSKHEGAAHTQMLQVAAVCLWELRVPQLRYRMPTPKSTAMIQRDRVKGTCSTFALHSLILLQNDFFFMLSTCLLSPLVLHHIPCNYITLPLSLCQEFAKDLQNPRS